MAEVTVIKRNLQGQETWRYTGRVLERDSEQIVLEARFNRPDLPFHGILLGQGDRFVETYYTNRWYNIFEIHDRADDSVKGWYCNVSKPVEIERDQDDGLVISYIDLALDLLVYPDGKQLVLDEDEFAALDLDEPARQQARRALLDLQQIFAGQDRKQPDRTVSAERRSDCM
jgi:predicted RNA-binding protein associated with RNAse of E/G family